MAACSLKAREFKGLKAGEPRDLMGRGFKGLKAREPLNPRDPSDESNAKDQQLVNPPPPPPPRLGFRD